MEFDQNPDPNAAATLIEGLPLLDDEASLQRILAGGEGNDPDGGKPKPDAGKGAAPKPGSTQGSAAPKPEGQTGNGAQASTGDPNEEEEEEGEELDENGNPVQKDPLKKVSEYPSMLHYLNERHKLNLNLKPDEKITEEEVAEGVDSVIERVLEGTNNALQQYSYIDELMEDPEIKALLEAKAQGKGLKDLYSQYAATPLALSDDDLVMRDMKQRYPKSNEADLKLMVDALKKDAKFETFAKSLRTQYEEEQSSAQQKAEQMRAEEERKRAELEQQEMEKYSTFVGTLKNVGGVPLTDDMKKSVLRFTTEHDVNGLTRLDHALQSNEGLVLATLGIMYMEKLIQNGASLQGNRRNAKFIDRLYATPDNLQGSSSQGRARDEEYDPAALNRF